MTATVDRGLLPGFLLGSRNNEELLVSHLLFVDDTLIFCTANSEQLKHLLCLFLCFEVVSGRLTWENQGLLLLAMWEM